MVFVGPPPGAPKSAKAAWSGGRRIGLSRLQLPNRADFLKFSYRIKNCC
jgi:hypothetical protein